MTAIAVDRLSIRELCLAQELASEFLSEASIPPGRLEELLEDGRCIVLAATLGERPIGYLVAYCFPSLSGERLAYLYDIEVREAWRRRGVGRSLVQLLIETCKAAGVESVWVGSSLTNGPACNLWSSTGAQRDGDQYVEFNFDLSQEMRLS